MNALNIDFRKTALVLIDLQKGIVNMANGQVVVDKAAQLVKYFRQKEGFIAFVNVDFLDGKDQLKPSIDQVTNVSAKPPVDWAEFVPELEVGSRDYVVTKRQWGAFFGTDLDLQLRRRGIDTIVLGGISTNIGVESTAREAFQLGYHQIFITDAMKALTKEEHDASCNYIFPRIGKLRTTEQFLAD
ncbi:isochorismatase family protein [Bacillus sp. NPDC094106]|uniref:isochorismatase family protein n=1 Tax=Bacillus sp. NPDC094106 TaxID=3363949 RepID=UPI00380747AD